jgi:hypothetical protein
LLRGEFLGCGFSALLAELGEILANFFPGGHENYCTTSAGGTQELS